jgi:hypothetical protein
MGDGSGSPHHSDREVMGRLNLSVRYTKRLDDAGAVASVGSTGDSYDTLAEALNSLLEADLVRNKGPWKGIDDLEIAVAEYLDWFDHRRLHGAIGLISPAEHEDNLYRHNTAAATVAASVPRLHWTRHGTLLDLRQVWRCSADAGHFTRYERRADLHLGLLQLACALNCYRQLPEAF